MPECKTYFARVAIAALFLFGAAALTVAAQPAKTAEVGAAPAAPAAGDLPKLDFDSPPPGEKSPITGKLTGVGKLTDYKLLILVSNDKKKWWDKTHNSKSISIESDGSFKIEKWASDPHDLTVSYIGIWAVPASFDTTGKNYSVEGAALPEKVTEIAIASQIKGRKEVPQIDFVPPALNTSDPITGKVTGVDNPADYKVVLLLSRDQKIWWDKTHNVHGITIQPDGTFTVKGWSNVPQTLTTPYMGVWLVPQSFDTHAPNFQVEGAAVPEKLTAAAVAMKIKSREPSEQAKPDASKPDAGKPDARATKPAASMPAESSKADAGKSDAAAALPATNDAPVLGPGAIGGAVVDFEAPVLGSDAPIIGKLGGVSNPADYKGIVLVSRDQKVWWNKTHNGSGIAIQPDGTFTAKGWATPERTLTTPYVAVWLVPQSFDLHAPNFQVEGTAVSEKLIAAAVAMKIKTRQTGTSTDDAKSISKLLPAIRLRAGSTTAFKDSEGNVWFPDVASKEGGFEGGDLAERPDDMVIQNTKEQGLYRCEHWGMDSFSYTLPNGKYLVQLHFAETYDGIGGPGGRVFSFSVQDKEFKDFDVWQKAGGPKRAYIEKVPVEITDGKLKITFTSKVDYPEINGIEIIRADTAASIAVPTPLARPSEEPTTQTNPVPIGDPIANVKIERAFPKLTFPRPILVTYPPDGTNRIAVISEYGTIYLFPNDPSVEDSHEVLDIKDKVVYRDNQPEEGFLGLAFHPKFKDNGLFYVYYTTKAGPPHTGTLMRYHMSKDDPNKADPDSAEEIFHSPRKPNWNHNGGTILFGPDGYLYLCLGDGGDANDPPGNAQNISKVLGKVLRIDVDHPDGDKKYSIPKDNPFVDVPEAAPEVWALGLRNIWRMSFDRLTHKLWAGDVGQDTWEEVDIIEPGHNYEWNQREGFHPLHARGPKPGPAPERTYGILTEPLFDYNHSLGKCIIGGHVYRGKEVPELYGAYLFADHITARVYALWYDDKAGKVTNVQPVDPPKGPSNGMPIFSFGEDEPGELYFTNTQGYIMRFRSTANEAATQPAGMMPVADFPKDYKGTPFTDSEYKDGAQKIPGKLMCAYYDLGGEGVAYHDTDAKNKGSGGLNPLDGKYLNEFRAKEGVDTSYTKDFADFWEGEAVKPPKDMLYVGWTEPGEWVNYTADVAEDGNYTVDILYTSNRGGELSLDVNGKPLDKAITIESTNDSKDTTAWRQWHHWNINKDAATVKLSKGRNLLTLHVVEKGNMNLGTLEFKLLK